MRFNALPLPLLALTLLASSAHAQAFIGANLEWTHFTYRYDPYPDESGTMLSIGGYYLHPGFRLGYAFPGGALVASADVGLQKTGGDALGNYTNVIVEPGVVYVLLRERPASPYVGIGFGWHRLSLGGNSVTRPTVGGAMGVRHRVAGGHGVLRAELRYDHFTKEDTGGFLLPATGIGVRLGFDLLLSR